MKRYHQDLFPETDALMRKIAKKKRWGFKVVLDEAIKMLARDML